MEQPQLVRLSLKRAEESEATEELSGKRLKVDEAVDNNQDNQSIDCNEVRLNRAMEMTPSSSQIHPQCAKQLESVERKSQVSLCKKACDDQETYGDDVLNYGPVTSQRIPHLSKMSAEIFNHMMTKPTLVASGQLIRKKILLSNSARNLSIASQNPPYVMRSTILTSVQPPKLYQCSEFSLHQQPCTPKTQPNSSMKSKNDRQMLAQKSILSLTSTIRNSVAQDVSASRNNCLLNEEHQKREYMVKHPVSLDYGTSSDFESSSNCETISDHEMSASKAPVETRNNVYCSEISTKSNSADLRINAQNSTSTNKPMHHVRASVACSSGHVVPEIPHVTENRHTGVLVDDSSDDDQHNDNANNETLNQGYKSLWKFVLPSEYDPHDSRWTLKYRQNMPGLLELLPQSRVYISYGGLTYAQRESNNCRKLARLLLPEVFSKTALSVCLSMSEKPQASNNTGSKVRPSLDGHASMVLFNFVLKCSHERGWNIVKKDILDSIHSIVQQFRFKYGVMVKC